MQTIFCLVAARTLQSGNDKGKESKRSEKLFSFQKHFTSDKVAVTKLFCFVARAATWIWAVFLRLICTKALQVKKHFTHSLSLSMRPYYESTPSSEQLLIEKHFQSFASVLRLGGKFFPVHANALNFNHENIIIKTRDQELSNIH